MRVIGLAGFIGVILLISGFIVIMEEDSGLSPANEPGQDSEQQEAGNADLRVEPADGQPLMDLQGASGDNFAAPGLEQASDAVGNSLQPNSGQSTFTPRSDSNLQ